MHVSEVQAVELVFLLLLLFVAVFGMLAKRLKIPYPIVLVIAGGLLGFIPLVPNIRLNPDVIFFVLLPPLLYSSAWTTSWRDFRYNIVSIFLLAFGLVGFTVFGIAGGVHYFFPGFDWRLGLVLGAVVAPTDAIAATSIAQRVGLPRRIRDILEGESLVNDATGLLALELALAVLVRGEAPSVTEGLLRLVYLIAVGLAVGLLIGAVVAWLERRLEDAPIEIALSILVPYGAYFAAERLRASGVLAVVACGLYLSRRSSGFFSPTVRLQVWAVWEGLTFILNGLVFVLIGLQLPNVVAGIRGYSAKELAWLGVLFSMLVIALRLIWVFPGARVAYFLRTRLQHQQLECPPFGGIFILGWAGMRGVIALAAAIALPITLASGEPFPQRNLIVYLAFCVIFVTLVLQGLTLPWVVRFFKLDGADQGGVEEAEARRVVLQAALDRLEELRQKSDRRFDAVYDDLAGHYRQRLMAAVGSEDANDETNPEHHRKMSRLLRELLKVERETALRLRDQGKINDETLRQLEYELDLREAGPTHVT